MASRDEIVAYCDLVLDVPSFDDYAPNGLQVPGVQEVGAIATAVSANLESLQLAIDGGAQLVLVHHGVIWGSGAEPLTPMMAGRLRTLLGSHTGLAGYHLPLDAHPKIGNNALLRDALGLVPDPRPFAKAKGSHIGAIGFDETGIDIVDLEARLRAATGVEPLVFDTGPDAIHTVGIVTGGGAFAIHEAAEMGLDALVTGEPTEPVMGEAREYGIHFLAGGHYATEILGIRRLGELVGARFEVGHRFIHVPNPV